MAEKVLWEALEGKTYDDAQAPELAPTLAERVKQAVRGACAFDGWSLDGQSIPHACMRAWCGRPLTYSSTHGPDSHIYPFTRTAALRIPRYKVVVQVTLGELKEQGIRVASRCLWDPSTDNYASAGFKNVSRPVVDC